MTISEKVAYLKGLADGLDLDQETSKEGKLIAKIIDVLEDVGFAVEDLEVEVEALADGMESMAEDLSDVETVIFDEEDEDENGCCGSCSALDDDDFFQIACPSWMTTAHLKPAMKSPAPTAGTSSPWTSPTNLWTRTSPRRNASPPIEEKKDGICRPFFVA